MGFLDDFFDEPDVPPPPDMSAVINAAKSLGTLSTEFAKEQLDWARKEYDTNKAKIGEYTDQIIKDSDTARSMVSNFQELSNQQVGLAEGATGIKEAAMQHAGTQQAVQQKQLGIQDTQLANQEAFKDIQQQQVGLQQDFRGDQQAAQQKADQLFQQYSTQYDPAMARYLADAEAYGTPERIAQARAGAQANVGQQFDAAREAATRQLESFGLDPTDTRYQGLDLGTRLKEAATKAALGEQAAKEQEAAAFALREKAIAQGQQLPGQANQAGSVANQAGSLVVGQGNVVNSAGQVVNAAGQVVNAAGQNVIGAGNAATSAMQAGTGAQAVGVNALQGATQAQTGALAADTAAANITGSAGDLLNKTYATGAAAQGTAPQYLGSAVQGTQVAGAAQGTDYANRMKQFEAEKNNTSGFGALLGTVAGPVAKAVLTGGASIPFDMAGAAMSGGGGITDASGSWDGDFNLSFQEGGAIPMSTSPSNGQKTDDVKAMLNAGEFIVPRDVTSWYGEKFFQNLIQKAQNEKGKAQAKPAIGPGAAGPPAIVSGTPAIPPGAPR